MTKCLWWSEPTQGDGRGQGRTRRPVRWCFAAAVVLLAGAAQASAADLAQGSFSLGLRVSGGAQNHLPPDHSYYTGLEYLSWMPHLSVVPRAPMGKGRLQGVPELSAELMLQRYDRPEEHRNKMAYGLKGGLRYHFLAVGVLVPYLEATVGMAATDLRVGEIRSSFTFVLETGAGVSMEVPGGLVVSVGYRFHHLSNAGLDRPNRGINADALVVGFSLPMG